MIIKGDKIKLVQKIGNFNKVGDIFEVSGVDNGVISFKCNYGTGCMTYDEFNKYFEKIEKKTWSDWSNRNDENTYNPFKGNIYPIGPISFRTNGKKVQVRCGSCKAEATCCNRDTFNFDKGYELAKRRLIAKMISEEVDIFAKLL